MALLQDLSASTYRNLVNSLNVEVRWAKLLTWLREKRGIKFSDFQLGQMKCAFSVLEELKSRCCTVTMLKYMLRGADLLETLVLIADPEPLDIIEQPTCRTQCEMHPHIKCQHLPWGTELMLTCKAVGLPRPHYQWYRDNCEIVGSTDAIFRIPHFSLDNEGEYWCLVTQIPSISEGKSLSSDRIACRLMPSLPQFFNTLPPKLSLKHNSSLTLTVAVKCNSPYHLQWYKGTSLLTGETSSNLLIKNVSTKDDGTYRCLASNGAGEEWSRPVEVEVEIGDYTPPPSSKLALLIGNSHYDNYRELTTPTNDILLLAEKFKCLDFEVIALVDLSSNEMGRAIDRFFEMLSPGSYAVFCFVGHGFRHSGRNYMMPIDCSTLEDDLFNTVICDELLVKKAHCAKLRLLVLIVDMCLMEEEKNSLLTDHNQSQYMHEACKECSIMKLYSAAPNQSAFEVSGKTNGIYIGFISKDIFKNEPFFKLASKANEKFHQSAMAKYQTPHLMVQGGYAIKLTTPATDNRMQINRYHAASRVPVQFSSLKNDLDFTVRPYGGHLTNAVHFEYPQCPPDVNVNFSCEVPEEFQCSGLPSDRGITLCNLQKAEGNITLVVHLDIQCNHKRVEDVAVINLSYPFPRNLLQG